MGNGKEWIPSFSLHSIPLPPPASPCYLTASPLQHILMTSRRSSSLTPSSSAAAALATSPPSTTTTTPLSPTNTASTSLSTAVSSHSLQEEPFDIKTLQYVEPTLSSLQCSVCCEYFTDPVSSPCGHTFCRECIHQALQMSDCCPLCRTIMDPSSLYEVIALSRMCDDLVVYCPHRSQGCNHQCPRTRIQAHLKDDCIYIGTMCRVEECRKKLLKKDLSEHMESCPYKRVECLMCNTKVQKIHLAEHHKTCPAESVTCPHCETTRTRIRHLEHLNECPKQIIPCLLSEFGCPWTGPRFELQGFHIPQCPFEAIRGFLELSKNRMDNLEQDNKQLRTIVMDMKPQMQQMRDQVSYLSESFQIMTGGQVGNLNEADGGREFGDQQALLRGFMNDANANQQQHYHHYHHHRGSEDDGQVVVVDESTSQQQHHEMLISENERIRSEMETLTEAVASMELKQNMAIMTESIRMQEEIQSLRQVCHGLRMQMHYVLLQQQQLQQVIPTPNQLPPPGSGSAQQQQQAGSGGGGGGGAGNNGGAQKNPAGRPVSISGPPRSRFQEGGMRQETKL